MSKGPRFAVVAAFAMLAMMPVLLEIPAQAAPRKGHSIALGVVKRVPYSQAGDPAGAAAGPATSDGTLKIRALLVDGGSEGMDHWRCPRCD